MTLPEHAAVSVSDEQLQELMLAADRAADAAAAITMSYFRQSLDIANKAAEGAFDPVTVADQLAETAIRDCLRAEFPEIGFYGEEHDAITSKNGLLWVVDPIDGTRAFMSGMPLWGTLIGLYNGQSVLLGLLDQPFFKERYRGQGHSSTVQSPIGIQQLSSRCVGELAKATLYCTTPDMFDSVLSHQRFERVKASVQLTRYGGDCYAYALLAAGYVDIVLDCDLKPYDIQALIPIIEGAGGVVTNWLGESAVQGGYVVACGSTLLHEKVLPLLNSHA